MASRFAAAIDGSGLTVGDRVAVLGRNCLEYAALHFGAARAGVVLVHVSVRNTFSETAAILDLPEARVLFHDERSNEAARAASAIARTGIECVAFADGLETFLQRASADWNATDFDAGAPQKAT